MDKFIYSCLNECNSEEDLNKVWRLFEVVRWEDRNRYLETLMASEQYDAPADPSARYEVLKELFLNFNAYKN